MWQFISDLFFEPPQPALQPVVEDENMDEVEQIPREVEEDHEAAVANSFPVSCLTSDGKRVVVPSHILRVSKTFKNMCDSLGIGKAVDGEDDEEEPSFPGDFPLGNITEATFLKVVEWCEEHVGQPDPVIREDPHTFERIHFVFTRFERKFLDVRVPELCELILAASFLDIRSLYLYGCQKGALLMVDKSPARVRAEWGLPDDLSEEEKRKIRKEHAWVA